MEIDIERMTKRMKRIKMKKMKRKRMENVINVGKMEESSWVVVVKLVVSLMAIYRSSRPTATAIVCPAIAIDRSSCPDEIVRLAIDRSSCPGD
jgi:hypothetical protein